LRLPRRCPRRIPQSASISDLTDVVVTSGGFKSGNPKHYHSDLHRLRRAQRRLSRKEKNGPNGPSNNWKKQKRRVAKIHAQIAGKRQDFVHKLTTKLACENQTVVVETLAVKNMRRREASAAPVKNHTLASHIADSAWGEIIRQLEYECAWLRMRVVTNARGYECAWLRMRVVTNARGYECAWLRMRVVRA